MMAIAASVASSFWYFDLGKWQKVFHETKDDTPPGEIMHILEDEPIECIHSCSHSDISLDANLLSGGCRNRGGCELDIFCCETCRHRSR